jgi:hypothetical protein
VIRLLTAAVLPPDTLDTVLHQPQSVSYEYTGCGYFLTLVHSSLPRDRIVCDKPLVLGESGGVQSGFVVFLENNHLTLECHPYGEDVPESYREQNVRITAT